jgi:hypothetical protein
VHHVLHRRQKTKEKTSPFRPYTYTTTVFYQVKVVSRKKKKVTFKTLSSLPSPDSRPRLSLLVPPFTPPFFFLAFLLPLLPTLFFFPFFSFYLFLLFSFSSQFPKKSASATNAYILPSSSLTTPQLSFLFLFFLFLFLRPQPCAETSPPLPLTKNVVAAVY